MPQVLLINPPNSSDAVAAHYVTVTRSQDLTDWANVPDLGILTLASALADIPGITPVYIDGTVTDSAEILRYVEEKAADLLAVGMSVLTASYAAGLNLLRAIKRIKPEVVTIVGNDHFTALPAVSLENQRDCIDYGFAGNELAGPFRALIADLAHGTLRGPDAYPGLATWTDGGAVLTAQRPEPVYTGQRPELIDAGFTHSGQYRANFLGRVGRVGRRLRELLGADLRAGLPVELALTALEVARDEGLLLKAGFVLGHIGMTRKLLAENVESICTLIDKGQGAIASVDIEVLSPEPGSLDYRYLTEPAHAAQAAARLGVVIGDADVRAQIARRHARVDVIDRETAMRDHARAHAGTRVRRPRGGPDRGPRLLPTVGGGDR